MKSTMTIEVEVFGDAKEAHANALVILQSANKALLATRTDTGALTGVIRSYTLKADSLNQTSLS